MTWEIRQGDALKRLREMPDESVQCCVTSPPYWGLRDYGVDGQLGLESTPEEFVAGMVEVLAEVRRVLRDDGTLWLNIGDSYWTAKGTPGGEIAGRNGANADPKQPARRFGKRPQDGPPPPDTGIKPKDLVGIPWMLAFALRADGWYLRRDIIWSKPNPMPESVTDRPTSAHEYLFLLTKSPRYFYDAEAIREPATFAGPNGNQKSPHAQGFGRRTAEEEKTRQDKQRGHGRRHDGFNERWDSMSKSEQQALGRNKRSSWEIPEEAYGQFLQWLNEQPQEKLDVWKIATRPYAEAHFATFPPDLVEPCILAGSPEKTCGECRAPWLAGEGDRALDMSRPQARRAQELADKAGLTQEHIDAIRSCGVSDAGKAQVTQTGFGNNDDVIQALADEAKEALGGYYREFLLARPSRGALAPSCSCDAESAPAVVLDPFAGAATTGLVATRHNRDFIGIELNPEYVDLGRNRIRDDAPLLNVPTETPFEPEPVAALTVEDVLADIEGEAA
jgi:DNA modification methylase